ncbi:MAG TPA: hypothetical protein VLI05_00550 [Candidatus Saccharimonadia bacterium]|nr:hypothetical protein [Candidatus Saccharimonadia bacterium]
MTVSGAGLPATYIGVLADSRLGIDRSSVQVQIRRVLGRLRDGELHVILVYATEQLGNEPVLTRLCKLAEELEYGSIDVPESDLAAKCHRLVAFGGGRHHESIVAAARDRGKPVLRLSEPSEVVDQS